MRKSHDEQSFVWVVIGAFVVDAYRVSKSQPVRFPCRSRSTESLRLNLQNVTPWHRRGWPCSGLQRPHCAPQRSRAPRWRKASASRGAWFAIFSKEGNLRNEATATKPATHQSFLPTEQQKSNNKNQERRSPCFRSRLQIAPCFATRKLLSIPSI